MIILGNIQKYNKAIIDYLVDEDKILYFEDDRLISHYRDLGYVTDKCYFNYYTQEYENNIGMKCLGENIIVIPKGLYIPSSVKIDYEVMEVDQWSIMRIEEQRN